MNPHQQELQAVFNQSYLESLKTTVPVRAYTHAVQVARHYAEHTYPGEDFDWIKGPVFTLPE